MENYWLLIAILLAIVAVFRLDFAFTVLYLFLGVFLAGLGWSKRGLKNIYFQRSFESHAFLGEEVNVKLVVQNRGLIPIVWARFYESLPVELATPNAINQVISLGARGKATMQYAFRARKRGYYAIGPLFTYTGDLLGLTREQQSRGEIDYLTIYPRIIPLGSLALSSRFPQGNLRASQPIFEDPSRSFGKRDYVAGDSLRRIDWKTTAAAGKLQVKQFEPSISLETVLYLNLNVDDYDARYRIDSIELAIVVAASLANWLVAKKQSVGLIANALDQFDITQPAKPLPPRKGRGNLTHILETLARLQPVESGSLSDKFHTESQHLVWGTTLIVITGKVDENFFDDVFQMRRRGLMIVIILVGRNVDAQDTLSKAGYFGIPAFAFKDESDLDIWRK